ncbi:hypothetical protein SAMN04489740_2040 [Arthrobacter alpinus]|uniref:Uncharacterized protein n=1 Tax=Arthrobacter alpinus TaxID=656366 RepID=A0A1H5KJP2_9MICC|nr:hypothetical protein SAMN04489740_2040 [Arthrobacter alpinus]
MDTFHVIFRGFQITRLPNTEKIKRIARQGKLKTHITYH